MGFSTVAEIRTLSALQGALAPLGYSISQKTRVLDVIEAASEIPDATTPVGPSLGDLLFPMMRAADGPLRPDHPWLRRGDWDYAFKSHFDFVVHAPLSERHATQPLFAVEFDGPSHSDRAVRERDCRKNRLCAASGLPLLRMDDTFLLRREQVVLVRWLAGVWAAHRREMPKLLAERDAELASMSEEERREHGPLMLMEYPHLDVDLVFKLCHPFPPTAAAAKRLGRRFGFSWPHVQEAKVQTPRWRVDRWMFPLPALDGGLMERWHCDLRIVGPADQRKDIRGAYEMRCGYPLDPDNEDLPGDWITFVSGPPPFIPAGPWTAASSLLAEVLCLHNTLLEIERWILRNDRR